MGRLQGKIALISGGARGQGAAEAKLFAKEGAIVVFADILHEQGQQVEAEINETGGEAKYIHLDVTNESDWIRVLNEVVTQYGKLDILVNNAGIAPHKTIEDTSVEEWDQIQDVNAKGVFLGTKYSIPEMRKAGGGSIINISSIAGLVGRPGGLGAYGASKGAVRLLTKSTAVEYGPENIRCNSVHPGFIETEMNDTWSEEDRQKRMANTPLQFFAEAEDVAYAVLYLASDESRYVTGSELVIDGGVTAQ